MRNMGAHFVDAGAAGDCGQWWAGFPFVRSATY